MRVFIKENDKIIELWIDCNKITVINGQKETVHYSVSDAINTAVANLRCTDTIVIQSLTKISTTRDELKDYLSKLVNA